MVFFPDVHFELFGGWIIASVYLILNIGIPLLRKGTLKRLLSQEKNDKLINKINFLIGFLSWWGTVLIPIFLPLNFNSKYFSVGIILYLTGTVFTIISLWNYTFSSLDKVITNGIYRFSRNPIYLAYFVLGYGIAFSVGSWFLVILHTVQNLTLHLTVLNEEKYCIKKYGEKYLNYYNKTPRYIGLI